MTVQHPNIFPLLECWNPSEVRADVALVSSGGMITNTVNVGSNCGRW